MVKYNNIIKAIDNYLQKCLSIAEIREKLLQMDIDGINKFEELKSQGLLNPLEERDYEMASLVLYNNEDIDYDDIETFGLKGNDYQETYNNCRERCFFYERRLIEGLKRSEPPVVDRSIYDETFESNRDLEKRQVTEQDKVINKGTVDYNTLSSFHQYFSGDLGNIIEDSEINHSNYLNKATAEGRKRIANMDNAIEKSTGLLENTTIYRGGELEDIHLNVGDHRKFKKYISTSFQRPIAEGFQNMRENRFLYVIRCPKGTKGICGKSDVFENKWDSEHEYLLPRNIGYTVLDIDYDNRVIEILLD